MASTGLGLLHFLRLTLILASSITLSDSASSYFDSISKASLLSSQIQKDPSLYAQRFRQVNGRLQDALSSSTLQEQIQQMAKNHPILEEKSLLNFVKAKSAAKKEQGQEGMDGRSLGVTSPERDWTRAEEESSLEKCWNDTQVFFAAVTLRAPWAMQMVDAFGKPGPAISQDNTLWPGAPELCLDVRATQNVTSPSGGFTLKQLFSGKYCDAVFPIPQGLLPPGAPLPDIVEGICVPDSCQESDLTFIINTVLNNSLAVQQVACTHKPPLDTKAIAAIAVCGVFALLVIIGTVLDVLMVQVPKWKKDELFELFTNGVNSKGEREPLLNSHMQIAHRQNGACVRLLTSFSLYTNGSKLLSTHQAAGSITSVHGVRFVSMTWVVLGHTMLVATSYPENSLPWLMTSLKRYAFQLIANATVAVDTFFVLSGLLVCYLSLKELERARGPRGMNWFLFYFHRFWRLTPVYMAVLFLYVTLQPYMGRSSSISDRDNCHETWWTNLIYLNNFLHVDKMCMGHSWYLADDMQFYILSPLIFIPFYYSAIYGCLVAGVFFLGATITPAVLTVEERYPPGVAATVEGETAESQQNYMADFYIKPYNRMAPYIVGILAGYILFRMRGRRMNKAVAFFGWLVAAAIAWMSLFGLYDSTANGPMVVWQAALYNAVGRTAWGASVAWVIIACSTRAGGFVNTLLSWGAVIPLSRLTYTIYLVHLPMMYTIVSARDTPFYMDDMNLIMFFFGSLILAYLLAGVVSLVFEAPMMGVEKVLLQRGRHGSAKSGDETASLG